MNNKIPEIPEIPESDFADLSAWLDGELAGPLADHVARLVESDPAWRQAADELKSLDAALGCWQQASPPGDLSVRIARRVKLTATPDKWKTRLVRWSLSAAAVAAVILLVVSTERTPINEPDADRMADTTPGSLVEELLKDVRPDDRFLVEHLDFFQTYELCNLIEEFDVLDEATFAELDTLESQGIRR